LAWIGIEIESHPGAELRRIKKAIGDQGGNRELVKLSKAFRLGELELYL